MVRDTRVLFKCNVEDHPELKKARVHKSCAGRRTLSPLLVFLLLRKQEVAHRSACIPTATQLWPFEDLLLLRPRPTRLRCRLPPLLPSLRHCVHELTAELLRNLLIRSLVEARLTRSLRLGGNIVHIDCTWVSENFKSVRIGEQGDLRRFSRISSSTSWSRLTSSLPRRLRPRHGLPSLPILTRFLEPSSSASIASPARRLRACSVMFALRIRTSSPRSTSCSLPCMVGRSPSCLVGSALVEPDGLDDCCCCCRFSASVAFSAACRLANSDSIYSSLHDQPMSSVMWGGAGDRATYICLLTSSPTSPACGAKRLDIPYSMASAPFGSSLRIRLCSVLASSEILDVPSGRKPTPLSLALRALRRRSASATDDSSVSEFVSCVPPSLPSPSSGVAWSAGCCAASSGLVSGSSARCLKCLRFLLGRKTTCGSGFSVFAESISAKGFENAPEKSATGCMSWSCWLVMSERLRR